MIKLIVLDVDGCLSDGSIIYSANGDEIKNFNVKDGLAIASWVKMGFDVAIITGRNSKIVQRRAEELKIQHLYQGVHNKDEVLQNIIATLNITPQEVAAIGDDLNDYKMLAFVGRSFTPANGVTEIQKLVQTTLTRKGGEGAVREMIDILIEENNLFQKFMALWK